MNKNDARKYGLNARNKLSPEIRKRKSDAVFHQLIPYLNHASTVSCYISMRTEADTGDILQYCLAHGKRLCVPVIQHKKLLFMTLDSLDHLHDAPFHTREPDYGTLVPLKDIDLMIVPLSAYDDDYNRTGYGKGYYDTVLSEVRLKIGIAFQEQHVDHIEAEEKDIPLDYVISA